MRIINNNGIETNLLIDMYWGSMLNVINNYQVTSIRFEQDCIHIFGLDGQLLDEILIN